MERIRDWKSQMSSKMSEFSNFSTDNVSLAIIASLLHGSEIHFLSYFRNMNFTKDYVIS